MKNTTDYRLRVQNKAYQVADAILRPGGMLHIVDRGEFLDTEEMVTSCLESHRQQARGMHTTLEVQDVAVKEYTETASPTRLPMFVTRGESERATDLTRLGMQSIIAIKR